MVLLAQVAQIVCIALGLSGLTLCGPAAPLPGASPSPSPSPTATASPRPTATPTPTIAPTIGPTVAPTIVPPTATPIATSPPTPSGLVRTDVNAFSILAPSVPLPETTPAPLCIAGGEYAFLEGDDFTQETPAQFARYTTQWEVNQYGTTSNWAWSDQYSGIGRRNDFGAGDTYMVHIDDANAANSYPGPWVNSVSPRPGNQILGTPPNAYLDIRAVAIPAQYVSDPNNNGAHWLTGGLQGNGFTFGYTEASVEMPAPQSGVWPALWTLQVPGGGGYDGTGTSPTNYIETDIFERFGTTLGPDTIQMTANSGRASALAVRPTIPGSSTAYHTYGSLWVPAILTAPAYIVFYIDRKPVSYYLVPAPIGNVNMNVNLQMGTQTGSFVGPADLATTADMKLKNYFTWQPDGKPCGTTAQPLPMPTPTPSPMPPPPIAANIVPQLAPLLSPTIHVGNVQRVSLAAVPPTGALVLIQGISSTAFCPTGFVTTNAADAYLCSAIVGKNGVVGASTYNIGGAGFDLSAAVYVTGVTSYTVNPDIATGWHSESNPTISKTQSAPANSLALAFAYHILDQPRYPISAVYSAGAAFNVVYRSDGNATYNRGMAMIEASVDPSPSILFISEYAWAGASAANGNNLLPALFTVVVQ